MIEPFPTGGGFTNDGSWFVLPYRRHGAPGICITSTRTGKVKKLESAWVLALSPDSRSLIVHRIGQGAWIWDLPAMDWRCPIAGEVAHPIRFSPDDRLMACAPRWGPVVFFDVQTGEQRWGFASGPNPWECAAFSANARLFLAAAQPQWPESRLIVCDPLGKQRLWERAWPTGFGGPSLFGPDARTVIVAFSEIGVEIIDAGTGTTMHRIELPGPSGLVPSLSIDGQTLLVTELLQQPPSSFWTSCWRTFLRPRDDWDEFGPMILHVYETETGRELGRVPTAISPERAMITSDRTSLIVHRTLYPDTHIPVATTIECWDMPPRKPLRWVLGVPLAIGVALPTLRFGWRRWRRRSAPVPTGSPPPA